MRPRANDGVYNNIYRELTAQVMGAAKMMVTVVATQELQAGDVLWRFGAETAQDQPRRGSNNNQCIVVRVGSGRYLGIVAAHGIFFTCVLWFYSSFFIDTIVSCVRDDNVYCVTCILDKVIALACC